MEQVIIYGAGNTGKSAYYYLKNRYECLFFVDSDEDKWGGKIGNLQIKPPETLKENKGIKVIVASIFQDEILAKLKELGSFKIGIYSQDEKLYSSESTTDIIKEALDERTIDLGAFLIRQKELHCKEMTFMPGSSPILDCMFIKAIAEKYRCKNYLEIGTYIGESINILTDCCEKLYSITAHPTGGGIRWLAGAAVSTCPTIARDLLTATRYGIFIQKIQSHLIIRKLKMISICILLMRTTVMGESMPIHGMCFV